MSTYLTYSMTVKLPLKVEQGPCSKIPGVAFFAAPYFHIVAKQLKFMSNSYGLLCVCPAKFVHAIHIDSHVEKNGGLNSGKSALICLKLQESFGLCKKLISKVLRIPVLAPIRNSMITELYLLVRKTGSTTKLAYLRKH